MPPGCCRKRKSRPTTRSTRRWAAISVAAAPTCASAVPSIAPPRRCDMRVVKVSRRDFVKITSAASAGLVLALQMPRARAAEDEEHPIGTFVHVGTNGFVTIYVAKSEMGQGVRTALPMIVADEMDADWGKVRIRQADLDKKYGRQGTGGSGSIRTMWSPMRQAGATARTMLVSAAATKWGVDAKDCAVAKGGVTHGSKKATVGELAAAASKVEVPKDAALKEPSKST